PALLTITGVSGTDMTYDDQTSDPISGTASLQGVVAGDSVSLDASAATAFFLDPYAGTNKPVVFSGYALAGADAGNYLLDQPDSALANIDAATPVASVANGVTFDGTVDAAAIGGVIAGVDDTPSSSLEGVAATFTYYPGTNTTGTPLDGAPSQAGTY